MGIPALFKVMRLLFLFVAVFWLFLVVRRIVSLFVRRLFGSAGHGQNSSVAAAESDGAHRLVRDPECGIYIAEERALPIKSGAQVLHFCSVACRDRYFVREHKIAANS